MSDQSFDKLTAKFENNIYGSTKGKLRQELLEYHLKENIPLSSTELNILDAGGGTGVMTDVMLNLGHKVTLTDISSDALSLAQQRSVKPSHLEVLHTDILSLPTKQYDVVICHAVLEWLSEPFEVIEKLVQLVKPGGYLSLSFFNHHAQLFGNMLYGNFDYVEQGMNKKNVVRLSPNNPQVPKEVLAQLKVQPISVVHRAGIRCFHDYLKQSEHQISGYQKLRELEIKYGSKEPYLWLGKYFLVIVQKHQKCALL